MKQEGERTIQSSETKQGTCNPFTGTECAGEKYFIVKGRNVKYIGEGWTSTQLLGSVPISVTATVSIIVVKANYGAIGLGVIDSKFRSQRSVNWNKENIIVYIGWRSVGGEVD